MTNAGFSEQRVKMVDGQVRTVDVTDGALLEAMLEVPRELFVPARWQNLAYIDQDILVAGDGGRGSRYIVPPSPLAKLIQLAEILPSDSVLVVGAGTGYGAAVVSRLAARVVALETDPALAEIARAGLSRLGSGNVTVVEGPLQEGFAAHAPYDVILVEGSVSALPEALSAQLGDGGRLALVEGQGNAGLAKLYLKTGAVVSGRSAFNAALKPLPGFERAPAFEF